MVVSVSADSEVNGSFFRTDLPADPQDLLLDRLARDLAPLFSPNPDDFAAAKLAAVRTICSYQPQTQADFLNAARTISFSMSALAALAKAAAPGLDPNVQLRFYGKANTLNRSADQSERAMDRRQRRLKAAAAAEPPVALPATPETALPETTPPELMSPQPTPPEMTPPQTTLPEISPEEVEATEAAIAAVVAATIREFNTSRHPSVPVAAAHAADPASLPELISSRQS